MLDWESEILNRRYVTILKVGLLPPNLIHTLVTYLARKTFLLAQKRFTPDGQRIPPIAFIIPEATDFFPQSLPKQSKETMAPLRDAFLEIFRRGRRHQVVIDYDSAYYHNVASEAVAQSYYAFMYDNIKEILNEFVNSRNPINKEYLVSGFDMVKEKGTALYFKPGQIRGFYVRNILPRCHVPREGESFVELWEEIGGKFKPVDPYYQTLNQIHRDIKRRVHIEFEKMEEQMAMASETSLSRTVGNFVDYLQDLVRETGKSEFVQSKLVNKYLMEPECTVTNVTVYTLIKKLDKLKILTVHKNKRPFTITINLEKLGSVANQK